MLCVTLPPHPKDLITLGLMSQCSFIDSSTLQIQSHAEILACKAQLFLSFLNTVIYPFLTLLLCFCVSFACVCVCLSLSLSISISLSLPDENVQRQKSPGKWNETDLDVSYEKKPHHTYDSWLISATFF